MKNAAKPNISINEVVVRDGFQSECEFIATDAKIELIDRLSLCGYAKIEITSFVSPKAVPNLRDAEEVARRVTRRDGVVLVALVPNERGCERALACGLDEINLVMSASETHNKANMRMTTAQSLAQFERIMTIVAASGLRVNGTVATAFGCPFEGAKPVAKVLDTVQHYKDLGFNSITLADTTGMASPLDVVRMADAYMERFSDIALTMHFHNTRGMGLANVWAAIDAGVSSFDGSLGGLGGCPFAPGATGNVCTEDTVNMLESSGISTGIDLDRLLAIARDLPKLVGHDVSGQLIRAGKASELHPIPTTLS